MRLAGAEIGDATGLGVLVEAYNRARRAGRRLAVVDMTERTGRLLRASRLDRALVLRVDVEATDCGGCHRLNACLTLLLRRYLRPYGRAHRRPGA